MRRAVTALGFATLLAVSCERPSASSASDARGSGRPRSEQELTDGELGPLLPPIQKEDLVLGVGPGVKTGDRVRVHYTGTLLDGTKFDSSLDRGVPFEFTVGDHSVIAGWELGVVGMQRGGKRKLTIPPHLGYGERGQPPKIGPNATLVFVIDLLDIV
jgi:FKBP-type peptidyl-prolyl cis-trans isomerase